MYFLPNVARAMYASCVHCSAAEQVDHNRNIILFVRICLFSIRKPDFYIM